MPAPGTWRMTGKSAYARGAEAAGVVEPVGRHVEHVPHRWVFRIASVRNGIIRVLDGDEDFVDLARLDRLGHVAVPGRAGRLAAAAVDAVDDGRRDDRIAGEVQEARPPLRLGRDVQPGAVDETMSVLQVGPLVVAVAGDSDPFPVQVIHLRRQLLDRLGAVLDLLLVDAGDLPRPSKRRHAALTAGPRLDLKDLGDCLFVDLFTLLLVRLVRPIRQPRSLVQTDGVEAEQDAIRLLLAVFDLVLAVEFDLESMLPWLERHVAELEPGDLIPVLQGHQVSGQLLRFALLPGAAVESPGERRAGELVADADPRLVSRRRSSRRSRRRGWRPRPGFLLQVLRFDAAVQPASAGEEIGVAPTARLEGDGSAGRRFAFHPDVFLGRQRRGRDSGEEKSKEGSLHGGVARRADAGKESHHDSKRRRGGEGDVGALLAEREFVNEEDFKAVRPTVRGAWGVSALPQRAPIGPHRRRVRKASAPGVASGGRRACRGRSPRRPRPAAGREPDALEADDGWDGRRHGRSSANDAAAAGAAEGDIRTTPEGRPDRALWMPVGEYEGGGAEGGRLWRPDALPSLPKARSATGAKILWTTFDRRSRVRLAWRDISRQDNTPDRRRDRFRRAQSNIRVRRRSPTRGAIKRCAVQRELGVQTG